jgi:predicted Zn-dependent protease
MKPIEIILAATLAGFAVWTLFGPSPVESVARKLRAESASPYRWCEMGEELLRTGKAEPAKECFRRAVQLAPNIPAIWMRAVNFYLQVDDIPAALACTVPVLRLTSDYDGVIFGYVNHLGQDVGKNAAAAEFLPLIADNPRALSRWHPSRRLP